MQLRVLSLFDGIAVGRLAIERIIKRYSVDADVRYLASEVDGNAMRVAKTNWKDIKEIGDVNAIDVSQYVGQIDLLIGGSPCQDLSKANCEREGLSGSRSVLFWKFVEALTIIRPRFFFFENVASMPKETKSIITEALGVEPIEVDSALVSAQHRRRLYWMNYKPNIYRLDTPLTNFMNFELTEELQHLMNYPRWMDNVNGWGKPWKDMVNNHLKSKTNPVTTSATHQLNYIDFGDGLIAQMSVHTAERLQGLPLDYTTGFPHVYGFARESVLCRRPLSKTVRFRLIGNAWQANTVEMLLSYPVRQIIYDDDVRSLEECSL